MYHGNRGHPFVWYVWDQSVPNNQMTSLSALSALAYVHAFLNPSDVLSFAKRWRPQIAAGHLLSISGINKYSRVCIDLNSERCTGAVVQLSNDGTSCLYVLHRNHTLREDDVQVVSILWQKEEQMLLHMRALRSWYDDRFVDDMYGDYLREEMERDLWFLSGMNA